MSFCSEKPPGIITVFINVVRQEKPAALWKGLVPVSIYFVESPRASILWKDHVPEGILCKSCFNDIVVLHFTSIFNASEHVDA